MELRKKMLWIVEQVTRLALWSLTIASGYGILIWTLDCISDPNMPIYIRIAVGSGVITLTGIFLLFILDEEDF